ncbi:MULTISPECIES: NEL-type E3 ubiquitin ligase domain-containing protein [unclassified Pseudomonas]|uniref:NEL-type E3 ubiquitin ligase domain-containing protein n=1 Tax=unclassified Pseudomonas TaxID=196821 RepID=UPI00200F2A05|nr:MULTISPECIES: NEL-type E3 ubiquitin ligase domain-containing protein [unclassified Pseudomonas]
MTATTEYKGQHYELIKSRIDPVFIDMKPQHGDALRKIKPRRESWMVPQLAGVNRSAWAARNAADRALARLKDIHSFAEPLLKARLREKTGIDVDIRNTFLMLYREARSPWYVIETLSGSSTRKVSLLEAALNNFSYNEIYASNSAFLVKREHVNDQYDISPLDRLMTVAQFQTLCRELDIGKLYQAHLQEMLLNDEPVARSYVQSRVVQSHKATLQAASHMALARKEISREGFQLIRALLDGRVALKLGRQPMQVCELNIMDLKLTGILILRPDPAQPLHSSRVIVYVPHDPEHPLKEFDSHLAFLKELTRQLQRNETLDSTGGSYWQFFSQFVDHHERGHFFADLKQRLTSVKWYPQERGDSRPSWRETPVSNPNLQYGATVITGPLWESLYQRQLDKILNDARNIAVPTADADKSARADWWANLFKIVQDILNVTVMVAAPFVPVVGLAMLGYTAWQLTNEVIEGVVDLTLGHWEEATEHVVGVVNDVLQLAAFASGALIARPLLLKLSPLIENMKAVRSFDGSTRLWHPDLEPYEQSQLTLPGGSKPDALGLHQHAGKTVLPLEGKHYAVRLDRSSGHYRVEHPSRPQAYSPRLRHNGRGAWTHEAEAPHEWEGARLMRRMGHSVDGLSDAELERIRRISDTPVDSLRRMHVENSPPPPLLDDTLTRFKTWQETKNVGELIRTGQPLYPESHWFDRIVPDMPGWPADKALKIWQNNDLTGAYRQYGNPRASDGQTLSIGIADVMDNKLPERLVDFLGDADMQSLLDGNYPKGRRAQILRNHLADIVRTRESDIFDYHYRFKNRTVDTLAQLIQRRFPHLSARLAESVASEATAAEHSLMTDQQRIPLRLKSQAREIEFEVLATRANEGVMDPALFTPDTERLTLNALKVYTNVFENLRIEVREGTDDGRLRCSAGREDAATVHRLIRNEHGRYEVHDSADNRLQDGSDFYEAVLSAIPEARRTALGYRTGQGRMLRQWVMALTETPAERRIVLARPPIRPFVPLETELLLRGPRLSKAPLTLEEKVRNLYPHFSETEVTAFTRSLHSTGDAHWKIARLESELKTLKEKLETWRQSYLSSWDADNPDANLPRAYHDYQHKGGRFIADRLLECFERKSEVFQERSISLESGYALDLSKEMLPHDLQHWWGQLPDGLKPWLDQITTLNLDGQGFSSTSNGLLKDFLQLRQLSARHCGLKTLPAGISQMQRLETLRLSNNQLQLTPANAQQLNMLTRLEILRLDNNPVSMPLSVGRMPRLRVLSLINTQIDAWPLGLFDVPRPRGFFLDLGKNSLRYIPEVRPGSDEARLIARTRVHLDQLTRRARTTYEQYRRSVGMRPSQSYATIAEDLLEQWPVSVDTELADETPGIGALRPEAWHELASEPGSDGFFQVLQDLTRSADYEQGGEALDQLTDRVWRMIDAMDIDTRLREELFLMSTDPEGCEDAGAQLFNSMGIRVLESEARIFSRSPEELERRLVTLAKGAARLRQVNEIARADIATRQGEPDEVEVHLAYETGLARRLELPWQSEAMKFRQVAGVSEATIDAAGDRILDREAGDGLIEQMLDQPFWDRYLRETWPGEIEANTRAHQQKIDLLIDLQAAQALWVEGNGRSTGLRQTIADLAQQLSIPEELLFTTEKMNQKTFDAWLESIGRQEKALKQRLTREAMARIGI